MSKKLTSIMLAFSFLYLIMIYSCDKEEEASGIDKDLYDMAIETNGFVWYKNSNVLLNKSAGSGHPQPFLKTRYNSIAATQLDSSGMIIPGAIFPEGSFVVKELFDNSTTLGRYAILYKQTGNENADANGWVWGYVNANGTVAEKAANKGSSCISCHSQADNIDYMLMNKYFP